MAPTTNPDPAAQTPDAREALLRELEHLAEHYEHPANGEYGKTAAQVLRDAVLVLRAGGLVCEHQTLGPQQ